jgi:predicted RNase H-like nuclease (RuvC/YqgF family)
VEAVTETTLEEPSALAEEAPLHPKLAKYQGDPVKLAEAYAHLEREKGRLANEVGDLRHEKAELSAELDVFRKTYPVTATIAGRVRQRLRKRRRA